MLGSGPGGGVGAFDVPFDVLAFDVPGVRSCAPGGVESSEVSVKEGEPAGAVPRVLVRGEKRPGGRGSV